MKNSNRNSCFQRAADGVSAASAATANGLRRAANHRRISVTVKYAYTLRYNEWAFAPSHGGTADICISLYSSLTEYFSVGAIFVFGVIIGVFAYAADNCSNFWHIGNDMQYYNLSAKKP